jgi:hypothetical protein
MRKNSESDPAFISWVSFFASHTANGRRARTPTTTPYFFRRGVRDPRCTFTAAAITGFAHTGGSLSSAATVGSTIFRSRIRNTSVDCGSPSAETLHHRENKVSSAIATPKFPAL